MALNNVKQYTKPHTDGDGGSGKTVYINMGNKSTMQNLSIKNLNAENITAKNTTTENLNTTNTATFNYLSGAQGDIMKIYGSELGYTNGTIKNLNSESITTNELTVNDSITTKTLTADDIFSKNIITDNLTVNKSAHFFELIIDKMRSVNGTFINTAANCVADYTVGVDGNGDLCDRLSSPPQFKVYWKKEDSDGKAVENMWKVYDQAICQSFNAEEGTTYNTSNRYYWRLVDDVSDNNSLEYLNLDQLNNGVSFNTGIKSYDPGFTVGFSTLFRYGDSSYWNYIFTPSAAHWDVNTNTWAPTNTLEVLTLTINNTDGEKTLLSDGTFNFVTNILTKFNIAVYYDDGTYDYIPADVYKTTYNVNTAASKSVTEIQITTEVIDKWDACNWIILSNTRVDTGATNDIPEAGDNIAQLGYRYQEVSGYTQKDINRSSAIIMAAYATPDNGQNGVIPPSYAQYQGINDFTLAPHRKTYFDATGGHIVGEFSVVAGNQTIPLQEYIQTQTGGGNADIMVQSGGVDLGTIVLQTDSSYNINSLNNFPQYIDLVAVNYTSAQSLSVNAASVDLFGRQLDLLAIMQGQASDSGNGIYIQQVTFGGTDRLSIRFGFRNGPQTIQSGTIIKFSGQVTISGTTYNLTKSISIAAVTTARGTDGQFFEIYAEKKEANVHVNGNVSLDLIYKIRHVNGTTITYHAPTSDQYLEIIPYTLYNTPCQYNQSAQNPGYQSYTLFPADWDTTSPSSSSYYETWHKQVATSDSWYNDYTDTDRVQYYKIILKESQGTAAPKILYTDVVNLELDNGGYFSVTDGMMTSIQTNAQAILTETNARQQQYSLIEQTAQAIRLEVDDVETDMGSLRADIQRTGIDIEQGKITLTADNTNINGNLNIYNASEGLIIYDTDKTPKIAILGNDIGTLSSEDWSYSLINTYDTYGSINSNTVNFNTIDLGQKKIGDSIHTAEGTISINTEHFTSTITAVNYTINILKDSSVKKTLTGTMTVQTPGSAWSFIRAASIDTLNISEAGHYYISLSITTTGTVVNDDDPALGVEFKALVKTVLTAKQINTIGKDGAVFGTSSDHFAWLGSDLFKFYHKWTVAGHGTGIEIGNNGTKYMPNNNIIPFWGELGSTTSYKYLNTSSSYEATLEDGFICLGGGILDNFQLILPDPKTCPGKYYFVKNNADKTVKVKTTYNKGMIDDDSRSEEDERSIGNRAYMFIAERHNEMVNGQSVTKGHWVIFYCS